MSINIGPPNYLPQLSMVDKDHTEMVLELEKSPAEILKTITPHKMRLLHASLKLCSEAGELADAIGKHVFYNQPLDMKNIEEELGDQRFYQKMIANEVELTEIDILMGNINKLRKRYSKGYSDKAAQERADKT